MGWRGIAALAKAAVWAAAAVAAAHGDASRLWETAPSAVNVIGVNCSPGGPGDGDAVWVLREESGG
ncbi:MAG TPA: hypothetical protein VNC50_05565 [Planctomycetia bacterium]|nr:hypothetical protein [Planctomycetia bacterium]